MIFELADSTGYLAWWRLILSKFDFDFSRREAEKNGVDNALLYLSKLGVDTIFFANNLCYLTNNQKTWVYPLCPLSVYTGANLWETQRHTSLWLAHN